MDDRELPILLRDGDLTGEERARIERRLSEEPDLAGRYERLEAIAAALRSSAADSFSPFFPARVMARIR